MDKLKVEDIAQVAHETNRAYCQVLGDNSQPAWNDAPDWQKESAIAGIQAYIDDPSITPEQSHEGWLKLKQETGWKYGEVKDAEKKEHPCFVPYSELPPEQKVKDALFLGIVKALSS